MPVVPRFAFASQRGLAIRDASGTPPPQSPGGGLPAKLPTSIPSWESVLKEFYFRKGATLAELEDIVRDMSADTRARYESAWRKFFHQVFPTMNDLQGVPVSGVPVSLASESPEGSGSMASKLTLVSDWFGTVPLWRLALLLRKFAARTSWDQARNVYAAILHFPPCQQLKFETAMQPAKRAWSTHKPKYEHFYDVPPLFQGFLDGPVPTTEVDIRLRAILLLRLAGMYRGWTWLMPSDP